MANRFHLRKKHVTNKILSYMYNTNVEHVPSEQARVFHNMSIKYQENISTVRSLYQKVIICTRTTSDHARHEELVM